MRISGEGTVFIRAGEGVELAAYYDPVNILTIGSGLTWASSAFREWWTTNKPGQPFAKGARFKNRAEADAALAYVIDREFAPYVERFLGATTVPQNVFDGVVSVVFNCGPGALGWKWAQAIKAGDYKQAAFLLRDTAVTGKGNNKKLRGLVIRRKEEGDLIEHGDYAYGALPPGATRSDDGVLEIGERGEDVLALQTELKARGHYAGELDGIFGRGTEAAVLSFQRALNLTADGKAGPQTLTALRHNPPPAAPRESTGSKSTGNVPATPYGDDPDDYDDDSGPRFPWWMLVLLVAVLIGGAVLFWPH